MKLLKLSKKDTDAAIETAAEKIAKAQQAAHQAAHLFATPVSEFIPIFGHYDANTLLTKNGELMQTIRVTANTGGLDYENSSDPHHILREKVRAAISAHVESEQFALWIHTIRKRHAIAYRGTYPEPLATQVHERWQAIHEWKYQYYNEIYITILHEGQSAELKNVAHLGSLILQQTNRHYRNAYLEASLARLNAVVGRVMTSIEAHFVPYRLRVVERVPSLGDVSVAQPLFYSEPMEFLGTLLNLRDEQMLLPMMDLSEALVTTRHTFGFNALETKSEAGKRRFSSILSLKQYREVPADTVDRLLQAPMEFIVTQAFHFLPHEAALREYREQRGIFEMSEDFYCIEASGIADMLESHRGRGTDFGHHQTSIMVMSDELRHLDGEVVKVQNAFAELGLITIREDVKLEECFWSQLPGNFEFLRRKDPINTSRIGGFVRLNRYPQGVQRGNHWGDAVTIFPTLVGSPYFFNFHYQDNGHTLVLDFNAFGDQACAILVNFLLCQVRKFKARVCIIDRHRSADLLVEKLGGAYHHFMCSDADGQEAVSHLNPFAMEDVPRNRNFILAWLQMLIPQDAELSPERKDLLREMIDTIYTQPDDKRSLPRFVDMVGERDPELAKLFAAWCEGGVYGPIFSHVKERCDIGQAIAAFDMTALVTQKTPVLPVFSYLLHRFITTIQGQPTVLVLHDAFDLIANDFVASRLESLMQMFRDNNAMIIFTTSKPLDDMEQPTYRMVFDQCATHLYLPDDVAQDYAHLPIGLDDYDAQRLNRMERQRGDFMMRQHQETIALRADLSVLDEYYAMFANDRKNLQVTMGSSDDVGMV